MYLVFTDDNTYIRIVDPNMPNNNLGYISPNNGQLNVRPELYHILEENGLADQIEWVDGPGMHGGVGDYRHTNQFASLRDVLIFFQDLGNQLDEEINFHLS